MRAISSASLLLSAALVRLRSRPCAVSPGWAPIVVLLGAALALGQWPTRAGAAEPLEPAVGVIGFDLCDLDAQGLVGPPGGKRAVDYEFCIPSGAGFEAQVRAIDASASFQSGPPGRVGCGPGQVLVIGNTHRPDFAFVLQRLAELPYVERIERAWFE
jgi:hypothetical protein